MESPMGTGLPSPNLGQTEQDNQLPRKRSRATEIQYQNSVKHSILDTSKKTATQKWRHKTLQQKHNKW